MSKMSVTNARRKNRVRMALKLAAKVFEASHDAIVIAEASGKIVAVNPSGVNLTGVSHPASRDMALRELLMDPEAGDFWPQVDARLGRDGRWSGEVWHRRADGGHPRPGNQHTSRGGVPEASRVRGAHSVSVDVARGAARR